MSDRSRKATNHTRKAMMQRGGSSGEQLLEPIVQETMTPEARDRIEWECDRLVALLGRTLARRAVVPDARLLDWLARDARERAEGSVERMPADRVASLRERIRRRAALERVPVRRIDRGPERRPVQGDATAAALLSECTTSRSAPLVELAVAAGVGRNLWDAECDTLVVLPEDVLPGRHLALRVSGDSMTPLLHTGDVILIRLEQRVKPNAIVVARVPDDGGYVVKRVGSVRRRAIELRSLNDAYPSITIPNDPALIVGTVILRWREHAA